MQSEQNTLDRFQFKRLYHKQLRKYMATTLKKLTAGTSRDDRQIDDLTDPLKPTAANAVSIEDFNH